MRILVAILLVGLSSVAAQAQMLGLEVRGGASASASGPAGPVFHPLAGTPFDPGSPSVTWQPFANPLAGASVTTGTATLIWRPPVNPLLLAGSPGAEAGISATLDGNSLVHAGLTWQVHLPAVPLFVETAVGAAVLNGGTTSGCAVLPYARAGAGVDIGDALTLTAGIEHADDFGLCGGTGRQTTNIGAQVGLRF